MDLPWHLKQVEGALLEDMPVNQLIKFPDGSSDIRDLLLQGDEQSRIRDYRAINPER